MLLLLLPLKTTSCPIPYAFASLLNTFAFIEKSEIQYMIKKVGLFTLLLYALTGLFKGSYT